MINTKIRRCLAVIIILFIIITNSTVAMAEDVPLIPELPGAQPLPKTQERHQPTPEPQVQTQSPADREEVKEYARVGIGFGVGFSYTLCFDSRFYGFGNQFALIFPLDKGMYIAVFHEQDKYSGTASTTTTTTTTSTTTSSAVNPPSASLDVTMESLRFYKEVITYVTAFIGLSTTTISGTFSATTISTDIGVKITPLMTNSKLLSAVLGVDLLYRYLSVSTTYQFSDPKNAYVSFLGGLAIGINFNMFF